MKTHLDLKKFTFVCLLILDSSCVSAEIPREESFWKLEHADVEVTVLRLKGIFLSPNDRLRAHLDPQNDGQLIISNSLSDGTGEPDVRWSPPGKPEGRYVWLLKIPERLAEPIPFQEFVDLKCFFDPLLRSIRLLSASEKEIKPLQLSGTEVLLGRSLKIEGERKYLAAISYSGVKSIEKKELVGGFLILVPEWQQVKYYSGTAHLEVFALTNPPRRIAYFTKHFKNMRFALESMETIGAWTESPDRSYLVLFDFHDKESAFTVIDVNRPSRPLP